MHRTLPTTVSGEPGTAMLNEPSGDAVLLALTRMKLPCVSRSALTVWLTIATAPELDGSAASAKRAAPMAASFLAIRGSSLRDKAARDKAGGEWRNKVGECARWRTRPYV